MNTVPKISMLDWLRLLRNVVNIRFASSMNLEEQDSAITKGHMREAINPFVTE